MTIRTRLTLWYAAVLLASLLFMGGVLHYELVGEFERRRPVESPGEKIADIVLLYGLPTALVLAVGGSWLIRRALRPIENLVSTAERVHAGNLAERIPLSGSGDEIDRLTVIINTMLARVEAGVSSVRDFTLHASHELKTPITILTAETELALANASLSAPERVRLSSQFEELRRLGTLIDGLGLLAKAEAGLPVIARESVQLDELLRDVVDDVKTLATTKRITLQLVRCEMAAMTGDRDRLRQALLNLLDNAVKHNRTDGIVRVALEAPATGPLLSIENTGEAIPPELLPRIFEPFVRGSSQTEGTGLGLSIAKTIMVAHGGSISAVNTAAGLIRIEVAFSKP